MVLLAVLESRPTIALIIIEKWNKMAHWKFTMRQKGMSVDA